MAVRHPCMVAPELIIEAVCHNQCHCSHYISSGCYSLLLKQLHEEHRYIFFTVL